jgi:hypothetical protein
MANEVKVLEKFRDNYLLTSRLGRAIVSLYYQRSPKLAKLISNHRYLKIFVRIALYPLAKMCNPK